MPRPPAERVPLIAIRDTALSVGEVETAVTGPGAGGVVVFVGAVRESDGGRAVTGLGYTAHPQAETRLREVAESVATRWPMATVAAVHRIGELDVGDLAVVVAAACPHRGEAFEAARALIDELKEAVPIWKHQRFADGGEEWVGSP